MMTTRLPWVLAVAVALWAGRAAAEESAVPIPIPQPTQRFGYGDLRALALSPDLRWLASGGQAGAVLWDTTPPGTPFRLDLPWTATALAFAPDGSQLFAASQGEVLIVDPATRAVQRRLQGHTRDIYRLATTPDGSMLASASDDNTVRLWSVASGEALVTVRIPGSHISDVAFAPDGRQFATVDTFLTNNVRFWDSATGASLGALPTTNASFARCRFSPRGDLVTVGNDRRLTLWDLASVQVVRIFTGIEDTTGFVIDAWFPNEDTLAAIANDGRTRLWNLATGELLKTTDGEPAVAAAGVAGEHLVLTANLDSEIQIRQLPGNEAVRVFRGHTTSTHAAVAFSPDGTRVLSGGVERALRLWDRATGTLVRTFEGSPAGTMAAGFSPDGSFVFGTIGLPHPGVRLWTTETGTVLRDFRWDASWPSTASLSPDATLVAAGAHDQRVRLFSATTGQLLRSWRVEGLPSRLTFATAQPWLAIGSTDSSVSLQDHTSGREIHSLTVNAGAVTALQFSPHGDALLVAWVDGLVRRYDTATFTVQQEFVARSGFLDAALLSPDGSILATGESFPNFKATLWDVTTGAILRTLPEHRWAVAALAFSADGRSLLTGSDIVREWPVTGFEPRLGVVQFPGHIEVSWSRGLLERAPQPSGPWHVVPGITSPWTNPTAGDAAAPQDFYRVRASP